MKRGAKPKFSLSPEIIEAYLAGRLRTTKEVASLLGCHNSTADTLLKNLGVNRSKDESNKLLYQTEQRREEMISLRRQGWTLNQIGQKFGITRERVRQLLENIEINKNTFKLKDLVIITGHSQEFIKRKLYELGYQRTSGHWIITEEQKNQLIESIKSYCVWCNKILSINQRKVCDNPECQLKQKRHVHNNPISGGRNPLIKELISLLSNTDPGKEYIGIYEVARITGLTQIKIWWLWKHGALASQELPKEWQRPKSKRVYSKTHALAIKDYLDKLLEEKVDSL